MSTINAITSPAPAIVTTVDSTGNLILQTAGTNAVTYDANQNATHTGSISSVNTFGYKNRIINGAMVIDQRNAGATANATTNGSIYTGVDRWRVSNSTSSAKFSTQRQLISNIAGAGNQTYTQQHLSLASTSLAASDYYGINQFI